MPYDREHLPKALELRCCAGRAEDRDLRGVVAPLWLNLPKPSVIPPCAKRQEDRSQDRDDAHEGRPSPPQGDQSQGNAIPQSLKIVEVLRSESDALQIRSLHLSPPRSCGLYRR